jgi:hypothetical protein
MISKENYPGTQKINDPKSEVYKKELDSLPHESDW